MKTKEKFTLFDSVLILFSIYVLGTFMFNFFEISTRGIR